ncbi:CPBP family intramembrane glutamic endopeptidase [Aquimarina agarilytica]|uniref:CPBP family intramembrane glutamic endopeptidase n=1 Tax=Aquimarina agarilytica TaxID=1087449 RepID=UPI000289E3C0|nr:CPBP family intramembrane glutamic endopeptidase [Aquimarina agarilytica]
MFLTQVKTFPRTEFWRYILGFIIIAAFYFIGQAPITLAWVAKLGVDELQDTVQDQLYFIFDSNTTLFLMLLMFVITLLGIILVVKKVHKQDFVTLVTSRKKIDWKRAFFSFGLLAIFVCVTTFIGYKASPQDFEWNFNLPKFLGLFVIAVALLPIQTSVEELIFRGYLMQGLAKFSNNRFFPLILTSIIFGAMHLANPEVRELGYITMVFYIGTGLFLGVITLMDEGMELALGFHAANNLVTALLVTSDWSVLQTNSVLKDISEPSVGLEILTPVLVLYPIFIFVFAKRYHWNNWKTKLFGKL